MIFRGMFVVSHKDAYIRIIEKYLLANYANFLSGGKMGTAFKRYSSNDIEYQILYQSKAYGTFYSICRYNTQSKRVELKSLTVLSFGALRFDFTGCSKVNNEDNNCRVCKRGFRNFKGRCH